MHDIFNLLSVIVILPIELISRALGFPLLFKLTEALTEVFTGVKGASTFTSPIKLIVGPLTKVFISVDKNVIKGISQGCQTCTAIANASGILSNFTGCFDHKGSSCYSTTKWDEKYPNGRIIKSGALKDIGDSAGSIVALILSLIILCTARESERKCVELAGS